MLHGTIKEVILEEAELDWRLAEEQVFARQTQVMEEPLATKLGVLLSPDRLWWECSSYYGWCLAKGSS